MNLRFTRHFLVATAASLLFQFPVSANDSNSLTIFADGEVAEEWDRGIRAFDSALDYNECGHAGGESCVSVDWSSYVDDVRGNVLRITHAEGGAYAAISFQNTEGLDLSSYRGGSLRFDIRLLNGSGHVRSNMDCFYPCTSAHIDISEVQTTWSEKSIPLSSFTTTGLDLSRVDRVYFWARDHDGDDFLLDDIRIAAPTISGVWRLKQEAGSLGVGPAEFDVSWWSGDDGVIALRDCYYDDEYIFYPDGSFRIEYQSETWLETWQSGGGEGCGAPVAPHDSSVPGSWSHDQDAGTLTISGEGSFIGLPKAINGAEISSIADVPASITYNAHPQEDGSMYITIEAGAGVWWSYLLERINDAQPLDTDSDGIPNSEDVDDDGDGVIDDLDPWPLDSRYSRDNDEDGMPDEWESAYDLNSNDKADAALDGDNDGLTNVAEFILGTSPADADTDDDGIEDSSDAFPLDPDEDQDTDGDGIGNNTDNDDDGDGTHDSADAFPLDPTESADNDNDGIGNNADPDDDNDGFEDSVDAFPFDPSEWLDSDNDGVGDNADLFPLDPLETSDADGDGIGDNTDNCVTVANASQSDNDNDSHGDACDLDDDNDGLADIYDAFPLDPTEQLDRDGDGVGDNSDAFPLDPSETADTDGDGLGDNADSDDDGDGYPDSEEIIEETDPLDSGDFPGSQGLNWLIITPILIDQPSTTKPSQ